MLPVLSSKRFISLGLFFVFLGNCFCLPEARAQELSLPAPGTMVHLSPSFNPPVLKGIKVHPENPLKFDFILDKGDEGNSASQARGASLKEEATRLVKYFLASLTIPEKDLWVNLSPYEKDRIVPESFGKTEMGRDLLAQDYILKQITASLIYPEEEVGKKFWQRIYEESAKKFGTTNIPVNTFNKVWIVPEKAVVYENAKAGTAYVVESKLKVMLEEDYLALSKNSAVAPVKETPTVLPKAAKQSVGASQAVRDVILPELEREINHGSNFAQLRQVYNSLILATWYKRKIKNSILSQVYAGKNKITGVNVKDPQEKQKIYEQYLQAFKKGAYNLIKEEIDPVTQQPIPRKYFSGGLNFSGDKIHFGLTDLLETAGENRAMAALQENNGSVIRINMLLKPTAEKVFEAGDAAQDQAMQALRQALKQNFHPPLLNMRNPKHPGNEKYSKNQKHEANAGVVLLLRQVGERWYVLLTHRPMHMRAWAGNWVLPGGRREQNKKDKRRKETMTQAALRELFEEVGVPYENMEVIGVLDHADTRDRFRLFPVVVVLNKETELILQDGEVDDYAWIDVEDIPLLKRTRMPYQKAQNMFVLPKGSGRKLIVPPGNARALFNFYELYKRLFWADYQRFFSYHEKIMHFTQFLYNLAVRSIVHRPDAKALYLASGPDVTGVLTATGGREIDMVDELVPSAADFQYFKDHRWNDDLQFKQEYLREKRSFGFSHISYMKENFSASLIAELKALGLTGKDVEFEPTSEGFKIMFQKQFPGEVGPQVYTFNFINANVKSFKPPSGRKYDIVFQKAANSFPFADLLEQFRGHMNDDAFMVLNPYYSWDKAKRPLAAMFKKELFPVSPTPRLRELEQELMEIYNRDRRVVNRTIGYGFQLDIFQRTRDEAMAAAPGGIDFNSHKMNIETQRGSSLQGGIQFHIDPAMLRRWQDAPGLIPVIINIQPLNDLASFLGIKND